MECMALGDLGQGNIDLVCERLVKDMVGGMGWGFIGNACERHRGVLCSPQELAGPGRDSLSRIKVSNTTASKGQKILLVQRSARQAVS